MVDQKNIQGDIWYVNFLSFIPTIYIYPLADSEFTFIRANNVRPRLPKKAERFVFFRITKVQEFKSSLPTIANFLTTSHSALKSRSDIYKWKAEGTLKDLIRLVSINLAFSATGLSKVSSGNLVV